MSLRTWLLKKAHEPWAMDSKWHDRIEAFVYGPFDRLRLRIKLRRYRFDRQDQLL